MLSKIGSLTFKVYRTHVKAYKPHSKHYKIATRTPLSYFHFSTYFVTL